MKHLLLFFILTFSQYGFSNSKNIAYEGTYDLFFNQLSSNSTFRFLQTSQRIFSSEIDLDQIIIDVFQDLNSSNEITRKNFQSYLNQLNLEILNTNQKIQIIFLDKKFHSNSSSIFQLVGEVTRSLEEGVNTKVEHLIYSNKELFINSFSKDIFHQITTDSKSYKRYKRIVNTFRNKTSEEITDLIKHRPQSNQAKTIIYNNSPALFMFCRHDRKYPCRFILRDKDHNLVLDSTNKLWSQASLASSKYDLPYNVRNGYTPSGVYTIDSVMPEANKPRAFGKFRRTILNFIPSSTEEKRIKNFLPYSAINKDWWHEGVIARDVGRSLLRIHGTGIRNDDRQTSYYPHVRTSGCISQKEGPYDEFNFIDQRIILDSLMEASGYNPVFENEPRIKGLLYVIEVDEKKKPVLLKDILKLINFKAL